MYEICNPKGLISIGLDFENCESVELSSEQIGMIKVSGLSKKTFFDAYGNYSEGNICTYCCIKIKQSADIDYLPFGVVEYKCKLFNRIKDLGDIASVTLKYKDNIELFVWVPCDYYGNKNHYMRIKDTNDGILVTIEKEKIDKR